MPDRPPLPEPEDDQDRKILGDIARVGWSVIGIEESDEGPGYAFSVGIFHTLGQPELVIMGLKFPTAGQLVNDIGDMMRNGQTFAPGNRSEEVAQGLAVEFVGVDPRFYREYFGYARWLNRGSGFPMLQCVWPDKKGIFPGEPGYDDRFYQPQRVLGPTARFPHGWPFPDPTNVATFTTRYVAQEKQPIVAVYHDDEGAWQFHSADGWKTEADRMVVGLETMLNLDPSLAALGNLPCGWRARRNPDGTWEREKNEPAESNGQK
jgi:hypothetical protein